MTDRKENDRTLEHAGVVPDSTLSHAGVVPDGTLSHAGVTPDGTLSHAGVTPDGTLSHAGVQADPVPAPAAQAQPSVSALRLAHAGAGEWTDGAVIDGRYEVLAVAGRGGMGVVHRVRHRIWNVELAVKTPLPHVVANARARERYVQEAETWIDLGLHPNIVQCWFAVEIGGLPRLFLDYISGGSLKDWMHAGHAQPGQWAEILDLMIQACDGLDWAHGRGMVHRDIKPGNLLVAPDGTLYVTDFGLVKRLPRLTPGQPPPAPTASGGGGTPSYGAPEQWLGQDVDGRADVYALGVTLFEMSTGTRPFDDPKHPEPPQVILGRHITLDAPDPRSLSPDVPPALADLITRCLRKAPADRPASAAALRAELAAIQAGIPGAPPPRPAPELAAVRADGLNNRAVSLAELDREDRALEIFEEALAVDRHHPEALFNQTLIAWRQGRMHVGEAIARLEAARTTHPRVGLYLAQLHLEALDPVAAERELRRVLDLFGADVTPRRLLGHALMCQERYADAEAAYAAALERAPEDGETRAALDLARARDRRPDQRLLFPRGRRMHTVTETPGGITAIALAPARPLAVTGGSNSAVLVWDLERGLSQNAGLGHSAGVTALAITPDGQQVVSASKDQDLRLWSVADGQWIRAMSGHEDEVTAVAISPDGRTMVSGGRDRTVRVWDLQGEVRHVLQGHPGPVTSIEISPDGRLAMVACDGEGTVRLWDIASGAPVKVYEGYGEGRIRLVPLEGASGLLRWSPSGIALYDFASGRLRHRFEGHAGDVLALAVSRDGRLAVSAGADDTLRAWDVQAGAQVAMLRGHDGAAALALSADAKHVILGSPREQALAVWELEADTELVRPGLSPNRARSFTETQSLGRQFATRLDQARAAFAQGRGAEAVAALGSARALAGYERDAGALALNAALAAAGFATGVAAGFEEGDLPVCRRPENLLGPTLLVAAGPDGAPVTADAVGSLAVLDVATGTALAAQPAHSGPVGALAVRADGRLAATAPGAAAVAESTRVFDLVAGRKLLEVPGHDEPAHAAFFTTDPKWLVTAALKAPPKADESGLTIGQLEQARRRAEAAAQGPRETEIRVWNLEAKACERLLDGLSGHLVAVAPSGAFALVATPAGPLMLVDLADGRARRELAGHFAAVAAAVVLPGETRALSAGTDRALRLWDLTTGACLAISELAPGPLVALALAPGGHHAAAACHDGTVVIVGTQRAELAAVLPFRRARPTGIAFLAGGRRLAVAGADGALHLLGVDWQLGPTGAPPVPPVGPVDLTAPRPPLHLRVGARAEDAGPPPLPLRARIALSAGAAAAVLMPAAVHLAIGAEWKAVLAATGVAGAAIAWGAYEGHAFARGGALGVVMAVSAAASWVALAASDQVAAAPLGPGLALALPAAAMAIAILAHGFRGEWETLDLLPPPAQLGLIALAVWAFSGPPISPVAVQVAALAMALVGFALVDALRSPDTEAWFAWRALARRGR